MTIRDAAETDLPAIVAIYNDAVPGRMATADLQPVSVESRRAWFAIHTPTRWPLWVMEDAGRVAGWFGLQPFHERCAYETTGELSVYVAREYQKRGIGQALLEHALQRSPALGVRTMLALVFAHNAPSLRLLERHGFARWGHLPRIALLDDVERDLVILGRRVDSHAN